MNQIKCTHCDGLGHFYNHETFQTEHCPHCEGKGYIETVVEEPIVEAPKAPKKTTKAPIVEEPTAPAVSVFETPTSGLDAK